MAQSYEKPLTKNDLGLTGSNQGGVCVPRANRALLDFFPVLEESEINPEAWVECIDPNGKTWKMRYVYYNGKLHNTSTRNEYRITCMTTFFKEWNAVEGSSVNFKSTDDANTFFIRIVDPTPTTPVQNTQRLDGEFPPKIILKRWRRIH